MKLTPNNQTHHIKQIIHGLLLIILGILITFMLYNVRNIQGTARVINYTGIVRGATQRLVKLEMTGTERPDIELYLDRILNGLQYGDSRYQLVKLDDENYQQKISILVEYWTDLKAEIDNVRAVGYENTDIVDMSETYFQLADEAVDAAEIYSQQCISNISNIQLLSTIIIILTIILILRQSIATVQVAKANRELEQKAYVDVHTGLPNKSRCEELLHDHEPITSPICCIMFDLNNLKKVNDSLGHIAGDTMILNFAHILRITIPSQNFVGRYGGDEFVAVIYDTTEETVNGILNALQQEIELFNQFSENINLSYAYGYAMSTAYTDCTLKVLLGKADYNMYTNKRKMKQAQQAHAEAEQ